MILYECKEDIYSGSINLTKTDLANEEVDEIIELCLNVVKMDINIDEIPTGKAISYNESELYEYIADENKGNTMTRDAVWRGRSMEVIKNVFYKVIQSKNFIEKAKQHQKIM